jgi:hypothetical protein
MYMLECVHVFIITAAAALLPLAPQANINSSAALLLSRIQPAASQNLSQIGRPASSRIDRPASRIRSIRACSACPILILEKGSCFFMPKKCPKMTSLPMPASSCTDP